MADFVGQLDLSFQRMLLALLMHDRIFISRARSIVRPEYFTSDAFPEGADVILMNSNLPQYSGEVIQTVVQKAFDVVYNKLGCLSHYVLIFFTC